VGEHRSEHTLVILAGGTEETNRFAAEEPRVDVLARPMARRGDVDHVIAKAAARNGVRIEFDLAPVLRTSGGRRVRALSDLRKLRELVEKYDVPYVVSASPGSHLEVRAPRELAAVGAAIGFSREAILEGLREWGRLAARNRDLQGGSFIEPGVRGGKHDEES
jgi:ribonuclease P/MRP protein subunit RPP1